MDETLGGAIGRVASRTMQAEGVGDVAEEEERMYSEGGVAWRTGWGSMGRMQKAAERAGHTKLAAKDLVARGTQAGTQPQPSRRCFKGFASFASHQELAEHVLSLPQSERSVYELLTESSKVRMWFDIEFVSTRADDGEERREHIENVLRHALCVSFDVGLQDIIMFWGKSSRGVGGTKIKHSYQLRIPSIVFASNSKDGALALWVREFVQLTSKDPLMICPTSKKHVIDVSVYSRSRQVRTCFSSKREDSTRTPLLFMDGVCRFGPPPQTDFARFMALLVEVCPFLRVVSLGFFCLYVWTYCTLRHCVRVWVDLRGVAARRRVYGIQSGVCERYGYGCLCWRADRRYQWQGCAVGGVTSRQFRARG